MNKYEYDFRGERRGHEFPKKDLNARVYAIKETMTEEILLKTAKDVLIPL